MADQNQPEATATQAPRGEGQSIAPSVDAAMDAVLNGTDAKPAEAPAKTEETAPAAEPTTTTEPEGDATVQPEAPETATTDAVATPQAEPLSPQDEFLLRRNGMKDADIEAYQKAGPDQRNQLWKEALTRAQHKLNTIYGMTQEQRDQAVAQERQQQQPPTAQRDDAIAKAVRSRLAPDKAVVDEFASKNSLDPESTKKLVDSLSEKTAAYFAEQEAERQTRTQSEQGARLESAKNESRAVLTKEFPKLAQDSEFNAIWGDPKTAALFTANLQSGQDVGPALREAIKERATLRYLPDLQLKRQAAVDKDRQTAIKNTAEPTTRTLARGADRPSARPKNVDEAMAMVEAEIKGSV